MDRLTHKARYEAGYKLTKGVPEWKAIDKLAAYENLEERLKTIFNRTTLETVVREFEERLVNPHKINPVRARILTYEEAERWDDLKLAEEQGLLLRVPVAKGSTLWDIIEDSVGGNYIKNIEVQEVSDCRIWAADCSFDYDNIGRTIFLSKAEAEAALKEMEQTEKIKKWLDSHDGDDYCKYCKYDSNCNHGVTGGPNGPIYPPCADSDIEKLLDTESLLEDLENEETEETE